MRERLAANRRSVIHAATTLPSRNTQFINFGPPKRIVERRFDFSCSPITVASCSRFIDFVSRRGIARAQPCSLPRTAVLLRPAAEPRRASIQHKVVPDELAALYHESDALQFANVRHGITRTAMRSAHFPGSVAPTRPCRHNRATAFVAMARVASCDGIPVSRIADNT
jgi:hypothetical protein